MKQRLILAAQLLGTLAIIAWLPTNLGKAAALIALWLVTFGKIRRSEAIFYVVVGAFFTVMDIMTVRAGKFAFDNPDVLGLPFFEPLMWGFYLLHTWRMVDGEDARSADWKAWVLLLFFAAPFLLAPNSAVLFALTGLILAAGLVLYHDKLDWAYVAYMIFLGAVVEYTGVFSGQWHYPDEPATGVPLWFATMWGGIGLLLRRLMLPYVIRRERPADGEEMADSGKTPTTTA